MKTMLRLGYLAAFAAAICSAAASDVAVTSSVERACQINGSTSTAIDLTGDAVNTPHAGLFEYQCNFAGGPVIINIKSDNGGLKNGTSLANYGVFLNDQTPAALGVPNPSGWAQASALTAGFPFFNITVPTTANVAKQPPFYVGLTQPVTVAGTYTDTLHITISP